MVQQNISSNTAGSPVNPPSRNFGPSWGGGISWRTLYASLLIRFRDKTQFPGIRACTHTSNSSRRGSFHHLSTGNVILLSDILYGLYQLSTVKIHSRPPLSFILLSPALLRPYGRLTRLASVFAAC